MHEKVKRHRNTIIENNFSTLLSIIFVQKILDLNFI